VKELSGVEAESLSEVASKHGRTLSIYDTQVAVYSDVSCYPIPDLLSNCTWIDLHTSIYNPNVRWGVTVAPHTTNQTLENLMFPDNCFDIVISSDVMEHVRLDDKAHKEIARVLKSQGVYIFTVPHSRATKKTLLRVEVSDPNDPSKDKHLLEPEYHGDPNGPDRALCYHVYGTDLDETLESLGFSVEYTAKDIPELGIIKTELFYCRVAK
jgi:SAM-dependent methyltransferase